LSWKLSDILQCEVADPRPWQWTIEHRVASLAFLLGLFRHLGELNEEGSMNEPRDLVRILNRTSSNRRPFMRSVVTKAEEIWDKFISKVNERKELEGLAKSSEKGKVNRFPNSSLINLLSELAEPEVSKFFTMLEQFGSSIDEKDDEVPNYQLLADLKAPLHLKSKSISRTPIKRLKMVLMIDEASNLVEWQFYNAFRWVIDQVIEQAWILKKDKHPDCPLPFTTIFMGTHSKVSHFLPPRDDLSARYYLEIMKVPEPFTALDWDIKVPSDLLELHYDPLKYSNLAEMTWLARFGRPCWMAQWGTSLQSSSQLEDQYGLSSGSRRRDANKIISAAQDKLHHKGLQGGFAKMFTDMVDSRQQKEPTDEDFVLTCSAIIGVLAILNLDFSAPKRAANLVASRLRWALGCDRKREFLLTTYLSEPVLAEAAFRLLFTQLPGRKQDFILGKMLEIVNDQVERGDYNAGSDGEFCGRILCLSFYNAANL
jgi:hypothetical protein